VLLHLRTCSGAIGGAGNPASCGAPRDEAAMHHSLSPENEIGI
jgi:hypothetical protein